MREPRAIRDDSTKVHKETAPLSLTSESKSSLGVQSSSSPIVSESEDEISPVVSEESQVSLSKRQGHPATPAQPTSSAVLSVTEKSKSDNTTTTRALQGKKIVKVASSKSKKVTSTPLKNSLPPLNAKLSAIAKEPASDRPAHKDQHNEHDTNTASQTLDSSSDLVDVTDSEMSIMSGLNLNTVGDIPRQSTDIQDEQLTREESTQAEIESDKPGDRGERGEGCDTGDASEGDESGSVTVTELSGEEEIEEDIDDSGEDTMFEETLQQSGISLACMYVYMYINLYTNLTIFGFLRDSTPCEFIVLHLSVSVATFHSLMLTLLFSFECMDDSEY